MTVFRLVIAIVCVFSAYAFMPICAHAKTTQALNTDVSEEEKRTRALFKEIRCPVCDSQDIDSSDADIAKDLRELIRQKVKAGESNDAIIAFLHRNYGDEILMRPPVKDKTIALWVAPFALFLTGILTAAFFIRKASRT